MSGSPKLTPSDKKNSNHIRLRRTMSDLPPTSAALRHQPATRLHAEDLSDRLQDVEAKVDQLGEKLNALTKLVQKTIQYQELCRQFGPEAASRIMETLDTLRDKAAARDASAAAADASGVRGDEGATD